MYFERYPQDLFVLSVCTHGLQYCYNIYEFTNIIYYIYILRVFSADCSAVTHNDPHQANTAGDYCIFVVVLKLFRPKLDTGTHKVQNWVKIGLCNEM